MTATDIDVNILKTWLVTNTLVNAKFPNIAGLYNAGTYPNVMYVADNRPANSTTLPAVRLLNGGIIPTNTSPSGQATGFTVATPNPLYVKGDYNNPAGVENSTDTSKTFPASLISDALTILSKNWVDSQSGYSLSSGSKSKAVSTTINAAILAGNVPSTGSDVNSYSGGVMNLPRLLEDWGNGSSSDVLTINTSMVNLFSSTRATAQFQSPGIYYYAPTRQFSGSKWTRIKTQVQSQSRESLFSWRRILAAKERKEHKEKRGNKGKSFVIFGIEPSNRHPVESDRI